MRLALVRTAGAVLVLAGSLALVPNPGAAEDTPPPALVAPTDPRSPADEREGFHLPAGFEIQLVASEPDIHKPMNLAFDDQGRLWVTWSLEYPFPAPEGQTPRDGVTVLADFAADGRARSITRFADGLNIPIGVLPLAPHEALVHSIPSILHLTDSDGDGQADHREVSYATYGFADTHGMTNSFTWGFDGWIYACHGFSNTSEVAGRDGAALKMQSGNTYRLRPDGSRVEPFTRGQVNPFGLAFDPLGNLYSCDCHSRPIFQLLRGAFYPSFGKPHDGLGFGPEMMAHDHGSTGIGGISYYAADHFPAPYRDTIFVGNVVTSRINHDRLEWHGSSPEAIAQPDFLTSDDPWFRPVDIELGPDGALYVADFYNRIIGHYEVPLTHPGRDRDRGRIWRIVYRGPDGQGRPIAPRSDWTTAPVAELVEDLGHPNLAVRITATNQLAARGGNEVDRAVREAMKDSANAFRRMHGLWVLERRGALDDETLRASAGDVEEGVRVHAMRVLAERPELPLPLRALALEGLKDTSAHVQRAAADALGRHPVPVDIRPLLDLRQAVPTADTHLLHVVRMALRDQLRPAEAWAHLPDPLSDADTRALANVALGVPSPEAARFLLRDVQGRPQEPGQRVRAVHHVARHGDADAGPALLAFVRADRPEDLAHQAALLRSVQQGTQERGAEINEDVRRWGVEVTGCLLGSSEPDRVRTGAELAGSLKLREQEGRLVALARNRGAEEPQRLAALTALLAIAPEPSIDRLGTLLQDATESVSFREQVAARLAQLNRAEARALLAKALPTAPGRVQTAIAVGLAVTPEGGQVLLDLVAAGQASARLLQERLVELLLTRANLPGLQERRARLLGGLPPADSRLQQVIDRRRDGFSPARTDVALGARVFEKQCAICHQMDGQGAKVGPQLDGVGNRGVDRLVEDILDPNRNIDQAFRVTNLALASGQIVSGLLLQQEGDVLVLADAQGQEVRVPKDQVEEQAVVPLSPMPGNLADLIPEDEFHHLLAYLLSKRAADSAPGKTPPQP